MPLYAFGWLRTEVNNGGFHQLFLNGAGDVVADAVAASRRVGLPTRSALIERAMRVLGDPYPAERQARMAALEDLSASDLELLDMLSENYFDLEAAVEVDDHMRDLIPGA